MRVDQTEGIARTGPDQNILHDRPLQTPKGRKGNSGKTRHVSFKKWEDGRSMTFTGIGRGCLSFRARAPSVECPVADEAKYSVALAMSASARCGCRSEEMYSA